MKEVRRHIALENDIPLEIEECTYKGECSGTCPRCEAEVQYLENSLAERIKLGKVATVAGLALGLAAPGAAVAQDTINMKEVRVTSERPNIIGIRYSCRICHSKEVFDMRRLLIYTGSIGVKKTFNAFDILIYIYIFIPGIHR